LGVEAIEIDARHGIRPQELSRTAVRDIRKTLEDANLRVSAISFYTRRGYNALEELDRRVEATKAAFEMAQKLGTGVVVNYVGRVPEDKQGPSWDLLLETLRDLGHHGQRVGAILAARTAAESGETLAALIDALPDGALGVDLDPGGLIVNGFSARDAAAALSRHVTVVHARDAVHDLAQGRGVEVPLGEGSVDFPEVLGILEESGYRGYFTVERESSPNPLPELRQALDYLRSL
jgi:sugar phosphate isomerase/epimerase